MEPSFISLLPPLVAIVLALVTKRVLLSLFVAVLTAQMILYQGDFLQALEGCISLLIKLFAQEWIIYTLVFVLFVGSIIRLLEASNAVDAFIEAVSIKRQWIQSKRSALFVGMITGVIIFIESSLTALIVATVSKPFAQKYGISKEKIAYVCDTTSAPVCSILPFNGWGALLIALLTTAIATSNLGDVTAVELLAQAVFFNFYAWVSLVVLMVVIYKDVNLGSMKTVRSDYQHEHNQAISLTRLKDFIIPLVSLVGILFIALYQTGDGEILKGDGSKSLFISVVLSLVIMYILYVWFGKMDDKTFTKNIWSGVADLSPVAAILIFAILLSMGLKDIGTADYMGSLLSGGIYLLFIPATVFIIAAVMAFATGTSWGTFAIMVPIAIASIDPSVIPVGLVVGAVISGGVFGDHTSPISDTTILASLAAECDHINHVKTQLPYALISASIAIVMFLIATFLWI